MKEKAENLMTEFGSMPFDWSVKTLKSISPRQSVGLVINPSHYFDPRGSVPMLVGSHVKESKIDASAANRITEASNRLLASSQIYEGDLVTVRVGEPGITAVVPVELHGCNCASMMIVRGSPDFDSRWLCFVMNSWLGRRQIERIQYGTAQKCFNISEASNIAYPVPPRPEQQAIATALSDADAYIESLEQLITKKRQIKQGVMQELLTGKRRLPGFEGEWKRAVLEDLGMFIKGKGVSKSEARSGDLPCVRYGEIYTRHHDVIQKFYSGISGEVAASATRLRFGDLLFAGSGETKEEIGKCVAFCHNCEAYAGGDIVVLRQTSCDPVFLGYYLNTPEIVRQKASRGQGDAVVHISAGALASIEIFIPDQTEQRAIAEILSDMDAELFLLGDKLVKARHLKQAMMQQLLTGKIRLV